MSIEQLYRRRKDELKIAGALGGILVASVFLADMLTRGLSNSPLVRTVFRLVDPFGMDAAAPASALLGMYVAALVLLGIDHTKRPQSVLLGVATLVGLLAVAVRGLFFPFVGAGDVALFCLGAAVAVVYVGPEALTNVAVSDHEGTSDRTLKSRTGGPLEFRSAERLLYGLLGGIIIIGFFEAHVQYAPLVEPSLMPNLDAITSFRLTNTSEGALGVDLAATGLFLVMLYVFLGYDAEESYFFVGPARSGKTHAAIAFLEEAQNCGYDPRTVSPVLSELHNNLVERDEWVEPTKDETQDLSFEFTSRGPFKKNVRLDARDYPGEFVQYIPFGIRYLEASEGELLDEERTAETKEDWLEIQIRNQQTSDSRQASSSTMTDGGVSDESSSEVVEREDRDDDPFALPESNGESEATGESDGEQRTEDTSDGEFGASDSDGRRTDSSALSPRTRLLTDEILPAFTRADTLIIVVDLTKFLRDEPMDSNVLFDIHDKADKESIVLVTKADVIADEFADERGWSSAWTDEAYDEFRTYVQNMLWSHNNLRMLLDKVERPYPVGYQTEEPSGAETEDEYDRELDRSVGLGQSRIEVLGYRHVLRRLG